MVELVKEIWLMLLHTRRCQCEAIIGEVPDFGRVNAVAKVDV